MTKTIAIIEDEPFIIDALTYLLEREKLNVISYSDGKGALDFITKSKPHLVILDIMLPNVSGMKILEDIRNSTSLSELPVLMLTAKGQKKDRAAAENAGASQFMTKPFANDDLVSSVLRLVGS